ncbi:MAG: dual specificity protein phosphatase family protein [Chloroflexi bacterium]|nr:dual specificity protein phosphatase family protein [Chloroflexota bacterium]
MRAPHVRTNADTTGPQPNDDIPDVAWLEPAFAIGRRPDPPQRRQVRALGIDTVITLHTPDPDEPRSWEALGVRLIPYPTVDWEEIAAGRFSAVVREIQTQHRMGRTVLLHCIMGINRAPTFAAAFLCWRDNLPVDDALARVRHARPTMDPTRDQVNSLRAWNGGGNPPAINAPVPKLILPPANRRPRPSSRP